MRVLTVALIALIPLCASAQIQPRIEYEIGFPNAAQHEARVTAVFHGLPEGSTLHARMARASPGRCAVSTFAKNVYDVSAKDGKGRTLAITRPDPHGWDVTGHDGTVRIRYTVWGDGIDGTYLSVDHSHARRGAWRYITCPWPRSHASQSFRAFT